MNEGRRKRSIALTATSWLLLQQRLPVSAAFPHVSRRCRPLRTGPIGNCPSISLIAGPMDTLRPKMGRQSGVAAHSLATTTRLCAFTLGTPNVSGSLLQSWGYMVLLALQFGAQPVLTKSFTPKTIVRSTVVLAQEVVKLAAAATFLVLTGDGKAAIQGWNVSTWMVVAGIPAALYVIQNYCSLVAYQNLSPVTFNVLNQTKTLSAALCCFLVMGQAQSKLQVVSLYILLLSALVIEKVVPLPRFQRKTSTRMSGSAGVIVTPERSSAETTKENVNDTGQEQDSRKSHLLSGVLPVLTASFLSGLAGALSQRSLMDKGRNSYLFTMELSAASIVLLVLSLVLRSPDGKKIRKHGFFHGWTPRTVVPVVTNALGGILVGLVTKYAGSVRKGFALIFGLLLSGMLQAQFMAEDDQDARITPEQVFGGVLAALSLWMHARFPHVSS